MTYITNIVRRELTKKEKGTYSYDSFRIRIPIQEVTIIHDGLDKDVYTVSENGEQLDQFKLNSLKIEKTGYAFYFRIEKMPNGNKGEKTKFLTVLINSKMMEQRYFEGIHAENIRIVYTKLMDLGVIHCKIDSFMNAHVTDLDVKIDSKAEKEIFIETVGELKELAKQSVKNHIGCNWFKKKTNLGIEFNTRERATISSPYFKIYHKEIELKERSKLFFESFLSEIDFHNLIRFEYTLKNAKMMREFGISHTTLTDVLRLSQNDLKNAHVKYLEKNFKNRTRKMSEKEKELSPMEYAVSKMMKRILKSGTSFELLKYECLDGIECRMAKSRINKKLDEIYHLHLQPNYKFEKSEKMGQIMEFIGAGDRGFFLDEID